MNKLLNKLKTTFNERKNSFYFLGLLILVVICLVVLKKAVWDEPIKAEILTHIAKTHMKNSNFTTALFGDTIDTFYDIPEELPGDSIEFLGLKSILENSKLKNTEAGKSCNYLAGICYYNLALNESDENIKNEYFSQAISSFDNFNSKNKAFNSRVKENIGDVFAELNQPETALNYYKKSLKIINHSSNKNTSSKLFLLKKAAQMAKLINNRELALKYYMEIKNDFPESRSLKDIDKYINELSLSK